VTVTDSYFSDNQSTSSGGAVSVREGSLNISSSEFIENTSGWGGGAVYSYQSVTTIEDTSFMSNVATNYGGALHLMNNLITVDGCTFTNNTALNEEGGAINYYDNSGSQFTLNSSTFAGNTAQKRGGAIDSFGKTTISNTTIQNNQAGYGGGVSGTHGSLDITDTDILNNTATSSGGGISADDTSLHLINTTVKSNQATSDGGGIYLSSLTSAEVFGIVILDSTISSNVAGLNGGGIYLYFNRSHSNYTIDAANTTISGNSAVEDGGGIFAGSRSLYNPVIFRLAHLTISNNVADSNNDSIGEGGGIQIGDSQYIYLTFDLKGNVISGNHSGDNSPDDCAGPINSVGYNLFGSSGNANGCPTDNPADIISLGLPETILEPLADNGGPTLTHALTNGSPAIDAVPAAECTLLSSEDNPFFNDGDTITTDQRGQPRPFDGDDDGTGECDSGAFEVQTAAPQPPDFSKAFANEPIPTNTPTTLTFTIDNPALNFSISNLAFVDDFPTGMTVATPPNASNTCGGTFSANAGASSVSLSGGSIAPDSTCTLAVDVIATMPGTYTNTTGHLTSDVGNSGSASVEFTVVGPVLPTFSKAFADDIILPGEWTTLTFTIDNPNTDFTITDLAFVDDFPADMVVAATPNITNTCGGTFSADAGASSVSLSAGELATDSSCTISVDVMANSTGTHTNTTSDLTSDVGNSGPATADIIVFELIPPLFEKAFSPAEVVEGEVTTLTFSIDSTTNLLPVGNLAFTDDLPGGMTVTDTPNINNTCGGTVSAEAGASTIGLTGGEVAAEESCTIQVDVLATQPGMHTNTTSDLTSDAGNSGPATADLLVNPVPAAATLIAPQGMINMLLPVYRWEDVPNATEFDLRLDGPDGPIIQQILLRSDVCTQNTCEFSSPGGNLTNGASYTWTVIPRNAFGEGPSSELTFMVSLGSTQLISPQGAIVPNRPVFTWEEAPATTYYRLQVNGPGGILHDAWHPSTDICASSICQFQMDDYLINYGGANFSWQVQSYGPDYTPWPINGPLNFSVGVANPSTPAGTITGAVNHLEFGWSELAGAAWYQLYLNGPAGYVTDQWVSASQCGAGTCTYTLNMALSQSGDYQWYVRAWEPAGYGSWSIEQNFTLSPSVPPVITKLGPTGTVTDLDVEFSWVEAPTAASYELYIAGPDGFSSLTTWNATAACEGGTCTATVSLPGNGAHTWYLRGINGAGGGPWGPDDTGGDYGGVTFNVDVPAVSQVTKLAPISGQNLTSGQVTFEWQADANATHYELYIAGPDGFTSHVTALPADEICAASPCAYAVLLPHNGPYTWYLRAIGQIGPGPWGPNDAGGDYGAAQFTVNAPVVGVVSKISPSAGQVLSNIAVPFEWQPEPNASSYGLYVAGPDGFIHYLTYPAAEICGATCLVEVILPYNDAYTWYLQGISAAGGGPWGPNDGGGDYDGVNFSLNAPSPEPVAVLESPADGTIITSSDPLSFEWAAVDNATWYQFVLADSQTHAIVASEWYSAEAAGCATGGTCTVTRHPGVGSYRWQVLAWGPGASGVPDFNPNSDYAWRLDKLGF
jgi:predicted outer membrane repeat protein